MIYHLTYECVTQVVTTMGFQIRFDIANESLQKHSNNSWEITMNNTKMSKKRKIVKDLKALEKKCFNSQSSKVRTVKDRTFNVGKFLSN